MVRYISLLVILIFMLTSCQSNDFKDEYVVKLPDTPPESSESVDAQSVTETITETETETTPAPTGELDGRVFCIDPGHGNFSEAYEEPIGPGATETKAAFVSGTSGAYQTEAEFNLKTAYILKEMLESEGAVVHMTRTDENATLSNIGRAEYANDLDCDMVVRIHADGSENTSVRGISVLVPGENQFISDADILLPSERAGQSVLDSMIAATGAENRGLIRRYDLTGFNWTEVPCILIECGFMSNPEDDLLLADESYRILLAEGITRGLIEYYMTVQ